MNATAAMARLSRMTQAMVAPTLSEGELTDLLSYAAVTDTGGLLPTDDGWTATYSTVLLNSAAAEGWHTKAAKLAAGENFSADGASFDPQQRRAFCLSMAAEYKKRVRGTSSVYGRTAEGAGINDADDLLLVN